MGNNDEYHLSTSAWKSCLNGSVCEEVMTGKLLLKELSNCFALFSILSAIL